MRRALLIAAIWLSCLGLSWGEPVPSAEVTPQPSPLRTFTWSADADLRMLGQSWSWFTPTAPFDGAYSFLGERLRARVRCKGEGFGALFELQENALLGLPTHAVAPAPQGQLGLGASYAAVAQRPSISSLGLRQALLRIGRPDDVVLQFGRMEYASGMEVPNADDPILNWMKRARIKDRLIGTFDFSEFGRTFDAGRLDVDGEFDHFSAFLAWPTQGGFESHFATEMPRVRVSNVAWTFKHSLRLPDSEAQVFWMRYDDTRNVPFVDNRPIPRRGVVSTQGGIHIDSYGFHFVSRLGSQGDALAWYAHQTGRWGTLTHKADAYAVELGWRPKDVAWNPWFRVGHAYMSGDPNPSDAQHNTFYSPLPTVRAYARFPFYGLMNLDDSFAQVLLAPWKGGTVRFDAHALSLASSADLWYAGSGAFQENGSFGMAGRPSGRKSGLATLLDASIEHSFDQNNKLSLYFGRAFGGSVIKSIYPRNANGSMLFLDYSLRLP